MRKYLLLIPILLTVFLWVSAFATDNIGNWRGGNARYGSATNSSNFIQFYGNDPYEMATLNVWTNETFTWPAAADTVSTHTAGVSGVFNISDWRGAEGYFYARLDAAATEIDMIFQTAPTDTGPWVNQITMIDNSNATTIFADTLDLSGCGPYGRVAVINDTVTRNDSLLYLYLVFERTEENGGQ